MLESMAVVGFELRRREIADRRVLPLGVVVLDVLGEV